LLFIARCRRFDAFSSIGRGIAEVEGRSWSARFSVIKSSSEPEASEV
jgi:hypothetical protein